MHKILRTFMWTISSSLFLFPLSGFCWGQEEKPLTNNVITQETKSDDELKQQVNAFMQRGEVRQAVELMKGAGLSLEIPILSSDAHELGIREASDVSKVVAEFAKGDVIRVVNYSAVGMDHRRSVIPAGKYVYVSYLKRKGSSEWTEVSGVVFTKSVSRTSIEGVSKEVPDLQTPIQITSPIAIQKVRPPEFSKEYLKRLREWIDF